MAYHFHWSHDEVIHLEHGDRIRWVQEISGINRKMSHQVESSVPG